MQYVFILVTDLQMSKHTKTYNISQKRFVFVEFGKASSPRQANFVVPYATHILLYIHK